jgi:predicted NAD/FAD-binding protein
LRSVIQYAFQKSGYVVEITLDRSWNGPDTRPDPQIFAGVSLFHPQWDLEMETLRDSTNRRTWTCNSFFESGFNEFLAAVQMIQELLSVTANEVEQEAATKLIMFEAADEIVSETER